MDLFIGLKYFFIILLVFGGIANLWSILYSIPIALKYKVNVIPWTTKLSSIDDKELKSLFYKLRLTLIIAYLCFFFAFFSVFLVGLLSYIM